MADRSGIPRLQPGGAVKAWLPILGLALAGLGAPQANAQTWPTGTVTFIVGFAAGGSSDIAARVVAQ